MPFPRARFPEHSIGSAAQPETWHTWSAVTQGDEVTRGLREGRVRRVFHEALDRSPRQRQTFLASACGSDDTLRRDVEALLESLCGADAERLNTSGPTAVGLAPGERPPAPASGAPRRAEGVEIAGRYRLVQELGRGGMGVVVKARDRLLARLVALKFLHTSDAADPQTRERFAREARAAAAVTHPRLCTIYEVGEDEGQPFLVMELLEGVTLFDKLAAGPLPLSELLDIGIQVADGVEAIQAAGIIHRDLKPANVFLTPRGVKILDFGLAKVGRSDEATLHGFETQPGLMVGTIAYMAPEQARAEKLDARADVFALGAVLYEMATGHPAFAGPTPALIFDQVLNREPRRPSERNPAVPAALEAVIARALAKEPRDRYPSIAALRKDLERLQRNDTALLGLRGRWRLSRARLLAAAAAVVFALAAAALWHQGRPDPPEIESVAVLPFASPAGDAA